MGKKTSWPQYNTHMINRGNINFWISEDLVDMWRAKKCKKVGRPFYYSDLLIEVACFLRFQFNLPLRQAEGFFRSLVTMMGWAVPIPSYTQVCRRMRRLKMPHLKSRRGVTDIMLDATGLKIFGAGEWRKKKYGGKRGWKKLHLAMDANTGEIILAEVTDQYTHDTTYVEAALKRANTLPGKLIIDGAADTLKMYTLSDEYNKQLMTPPRNGGVIRKEKVLTKRNEAIKMIAALGGDLIARSIWGKLTGYSIRAEAESLMSRWKRAYGGSLKSRRADSQRVEVYLKAAAINKMIRAQAA